MAKKSILLLIALLVVGLSVVMAQDEPESSFKFELTRDGKGLIITGYTGTASEVRIPASIQGFPVLAINRAFTKNTAITSVVIPSGVTTIEAGTFQECANLTSIVIPASVTNIGDSAFQDCVNLASVNTFPRDIGNSAFQGCRSLTGAIRLNNHVIGRSAFAGTGFNAVDLTIRGANPRRPYQGVDAGAFAGCLNLQSVLIRGYEVKVGRETYSPIITENLFSGCTALTTVNFSGDGVTIISARAFSGCTALAGITIPASVEGIGAEAFSGCTSLETIEFLPGPSPVSDSGGKGGAFTITTYPPGSRKSDLNVGNAAFAGCTSLIIITIPETLRGDRFRIRWSGNVFSGCYSLPLAAQAALKQAGYTGSF